MSIKDVFSFSRKPSEVKESAEDRFLPDSRSSGVYDADKVIGGLGWYRLQYQRSMKAVLVLGSGLCLSVVLNLVLFMKTPAPQYFAATPDLKLAPLTPLDQPVLTQQGLLNWSAETVTNALSLDFLAWRDKLSTIRNNFDSEAFKSFLDSMKTSGSLEMIQDKRLNVSAVITRAPVITASGVLAGRATWRIEFPLIVSYESSQGVESSQKLLATVLVRREDTLVAPRGVVIQQLVLKRDS